MKVYTYSEARQRFSDVLRHARRDGQVQIRRRGGELYVVRPAGSSGSPLDVPGIDTGLSAQEIVNVVRESRRSSERFISSRPAHQRLEPTNAQRRRRTRQPPRTRLRG